MNHLWIFCFSILLFHFQFCNSTYVFTQYDFGTSVCKSEIYDGNCPEGTPAIFTGSKKNMPMTLGILNLPSEIFHDDYNMTEYGFPIFYEYEQHLWLKVKLIIANGKKTKYNGGLYYYVYLFDEGKKCGNTKPQFSRLFGERDTLSGGLYLNQRNASYAYFIYQSQNATCIFTIEFKDLFQGDYATKSLKKIIPKQVNLIKNNQVKDFYYPFFSIDPLLGTMVYLTRNGAKKLAAVHYKIDEGNITNFNETFYIPLKVGTWKLRDDGRLIERIFNQNHYMFMDKYPAFTSYGKATFLFFGEYRDFHGVIGFWFPNKEPAYNSKGLKHDIQRHLYFLDPHYFEIAQVAQLKPRYESASLFSFDSKCPYPGLFIIFAIIDFLLILILIGLIIAKRLGSKKMKLQLQKNQRRGIAKPSTFYGKTTVATTTTVQPSTVQPSTITTDGGKGGGTIAPTNLNTQFTTTATKSGETTETKTTNVKTNGINTATINTVTKQQTTTTQISAESATPIQTTKTGK